MNRTQYQAITPAEIERAKACNVLALAERHTSLKRVAATGGGEYAGPCPLCPGGRDRFRVQPARGRWMCRQCTDGRWQDAITLQRRLTGQGFVEAVHALIDGVPGPMPGMPIAAETSMRGGAPAAAWQAHARDVIRQAVADLWADAGVGALSWLHARGLHDDTLGRWRIGYIPADRHEAAWRWGMPQTTAIYLPHGILIPSEVDGCVWQLKVRRLMGWPKYAQVRGGRPALYMAETVGQGLTCVTEGELDALLLWQCLQQAADVRWHAVSVVTPGSQNMRLDSVIWGRYLDALGRVLVLYDQDGLSEAGMRYWAGLLPEVTVVRWPSLRPGDKDLTDYHNAGGDLVELVASAL